MSLMRISPKRPSGTACLVQYERKSMTSIRNNTKSFWINVWIFYQKARLRMMGSLILLIPPRKMVRNNPRQLPIKSITIMRSPSGTTHKKKDTVNRWKPVVDSDESKYSRKGLWYYYVICKNPGYTLAKYVSHSRNNIYLGWRKTWRQNGKLGIFCEEVLKFWIKYVPQVEKSNHQK